MHNRSDLVAHKGHSDGTNLGMVPVLAVLIANQLQV